MTEYSPIQDLEYEAPPSLSPDSSISANVTNVATSTTSALLDDTLTTNILHPTAQAPPKIKDGVFSNVPKGKLEMDGLPSYDESLLIVDEAPPYLESTPFSYIEDGDVLVDGILVGSWNDFIVSCMMSFLFDFLGYFITTLLSTTHAGRCGAKFGLGLTLIRFGIILQDELEKATHKKETENFMSMVFILIGAFLTSKSLSDYMIQRKTRHILRNLTDF